MRMIDADALWIRLISDIDSVTDLSTVGDYIDSEPTIDAVEVVRGEWIEGETFYFCGEQHFPLTCSICGRTALNEPWTYCPNCGARMKGE